MNNLPSRYVPSVLRGASFQGIREVMYGIGIQHQKDSFGMINGPFPSIEEALETVPSSNENVYLIRFNADNSEDILYKWKEDSWIKLPTLKRK